MSELSTIISTIGFPIFFVFNFRVVHQVHIRYTDSPRKRERQRNENHWEQLAQLTQAVNENSQALRDMIKMIDENKIL